MHPLLCVTEKDEMENILVKHKNIEYIQVIR